MSGAGLSWLPEIRTWLTTDYLAASAVLADRSLRLPARSEFLPGRTQVFSLAEYLPDIAATGHAREALCSWIGNAFGSDHKGVRTQSTSDLQRSWERLAARERTRMAVEPTATETAAYVTRLADQMTIGLLGADRSTTIAVLAALRVAKAAHERTDEKVRRVAIAEAWAMTHQLSRIGVTSGLVAFIVAAGLDERQRASLVLPFLEMAAYGQHAQLAGALVARLQNAHEKPTSRRAMTAWAIEASRFLTHIEPTRVATSDCVVNGCRIRSGERILVDVNAANMDPIVFSEPGEFRPGRSTPPLTFGAGPHHCVGRRLALTMSISISLPLCGPARPVPRDTRGLD